MCLSTIQCIYSLGDENNTQSKIAMARKTQRAHNNGLILYGKCIFFVII